MQKTLGIVVVLLIGAGIAFVVLDHTAMHEREASRRALEARGTELATRTLAAGSPLACLDGTAGDVVEGACEKMLFARPEQVAAAVSYVAARIDLLSDTTDFLRRSDAGFDKTLTGWRRALELDRFGMAAHVLATRDGCTVDKCSAFALVNDPATIKSNIRARVFSQYVDRHAASWTEPEAPAAPQAQAEPSTSSVPPPLAALPPPTRPVPSARYDFPSAASIPPVSIMNPEPKGPPVAAKDGAAPEQSVEKKPPTPPRRPQNEASAPAPR
jgi:hypothetical protein